MDRAALREPVLVLEQNNRRVLVIDADPMILRSLALFLGTQQCTVETASNAAAGIALAKAGSYALIIVSKTLPDMRGLEVMGRLRVAGVDAPVQLSSVTRATPGAPSTLQLSLPI